MATPEISAVRGTVRGVTVLNQADSSTNGQVAINERGEQIVSMGLPPLADLARLGSTFQVIGAAVDSLSALPTTTAPHSLWNGEASTGKCYVIDSFGCMEIVVDATQTNNTLMLANMTPGTVTAPTDAGLTKCSTSGRSTNQTSARTVAGATVLSQWFPHAQRTHVVAAAAGTKWRVNECFVNGLYVVRPGGLFSWGAVKLAAVTGQMQYFVRWHEVQMSFVS